jgi:isopentenyl-diphosphate delta-isomerase
MEPQVILVDKGDRQIGIADKLESHQKGWLHRAISVFIFNRKGELLIQQRADTKYHSGGLWTNTCCSHPAPGEKTMDAANRRLYQEMGLHCELRPAFSFMYRVEFPDGLTEHEYDHIFVGFCEENPKPDASEVQEWAWVSKEYLEKDTQVNPERYTYWFLLVWKKMFELR